MVSFQSILKPFISKRLIYTHSMCTFGSLDLQQWVSQCPPLPVLTHTLVSHSTAVSTSLPGKEVRTTLKVKETAKTVRRIHFHLVCLLSYLLPFSTRHFPECLVLTSMCLLHQEISCAGEGGETAHWVKLAKLHSRLQNLCSRKALAAVSVFLLGGGSQTQENPQKPGVQLARHMRQQTRDPPKK